MSRAITLQKFAEHELSPHMHFQTCGATSLPSFIPIYALLDLWCNISTKFHYNPCKDVGGVEKTNFNGTEGRTMQTLNAPLPFYSGGIKRVDIIHEGMCFSSHLTKQHMTLETLRYAVYFIKKVTAFQGIHVSPAKHSYARLPRKRDFRTDRQMLDKVIPMCNNYASQATQ